jgi:hypothetical protein
MTDKSTHTTGNDPLEGVDPGGTRPTKPGNPDKSGPAKPENVSKEQTVVSGNQNQPANERAR